MVNWPALLKLDGDDELLYLASEIQFHHECDDMILGAADHVIDCQGQRYRIHRATNTLTLVADHTWYSAAEVSQLIQAHEFAAAQVCVTKIYFPTVEQAVKAMAF
ncbi:DUF4144 family protein [Vibrio furnissii]|uniref:DUF4144 family protein n=1 Tax=Vibrio furnissii TaxID=29494 RepID=UPI003AA7CA30